MASLIRNTSIVYRVDSTASRDGARKTLEQLEKEQYGDRWLEPDENIKEPLRKGVTLGRGGAALVWLAESRAGETLAVKQVAKRGASRGDLDEVKKRGIRSLDFLEHSSTNLSHK